MKRGLIVLCLFLAGISISLHSYADESTKLAGYDNGFFIQSSDKTFRLNINAEVKLQHMLEKGKSPLADSPTGREWVNTFRIRKAKLKLSGHAFDKFSYSIFFQHGSGVDAAEPLLWGAEFNYEFIPEFQIMFGQIQMPMTWINDHGTASFIEVPLVASLNDGRQGYSSKRPDLDLPSDIGVNLHGDFNIGTYQFYVGNGTGDDVYNNNLGLSFSGRMTFDILERADSDADYGYSKKPKLSVGIGGSYRDDTLAPDPVTQGGIVYQAAYDRILSSSANLAFEWKGFAFVTEGYAQWLHVDQNECTGYAECFEGQLTDIGYYMNFSYFPIPKTLSIAARGGQIVREGPDNNSYQLGGAIAWYILKKNFLFQVSYSRLVDYDNVPGIPNDTQHIIRTQFTGKF